MRLSPDTITSLMTSLFPSGMMAEQSRESESDIDAKLAALGEKVDSDDLEPAVEDAREETADQVYGTDA